MFFALLMCRRNTEYKVTDFFFMADEFHKVFAVIIFFSYLCTQIINKNY